MRMCQEAEKLPLGELSEDSTSIGLDQQSSGSWPLPGQQWPQFILIGHVTTLKSMGSSITEMKQMRWESRQLTFKGIPYYLPCLLYLAFKNAQIFLLQKLSQLRSIDFFFSYLIIPHLQNPPPLFFFCKSLTLDIQQCLGFWYRLVLDIFLKFFC